MEVACKSMATAPPTIVDRAKAIYVFANEKGGMANLNVEVINKIIMETSGNSAYTAKQLKSDARVDLQVEEMRRKLARADEGQRRAARLAVAHRTAELERSRRLDRVCAVIDFDMFYAAVEIRDRPELASKPVAVGGVGMISTANYVARRWGVRSAMPGFVGQALCRRGPEVRPISAKWLCPSSAHSGRARSRHRRFCATFPPTRAHFARFAPHPVWHAAHGAGLRQARLCQVHRRCRGVLRNSVADPP